MLLFSVAPRTRWLFCALCAVCLCCSSGEGGGTIVEPKATTEQTSWTDQERAQEIAVKTLRKTESASYHVIRLSGAEKPHTHDRSDLSVFVLRGAVRMHLADRVIDVGPGDVIDIPRGVVHWAENVAGGASEAYAVFAPPFDGKDRRFVGAK